MSAGTRLPKSISLDSLPPWAKLQHNRKIKSEWDCPLFSFLTQINIAAENGLDLIAIAGVVAVPDICSSLISDDGRTSAERFKGWCAENLKSEFFGFVTPDDLYSMRCGVLHNGRYGDLRHSVSKVIFIPVSEGSTFVNCKLDDAYAYSTVEFCHNVNRAAVAWLEKNIEHPNVVANMPRLMQYRPGGVREIQGPMVVA